MVRRAMYGFTLVELVIVIVMVGILAVVVIPTWQGSSISLTLEASKVLDDIRYTQSLSMSSGQRYRWVSVSSSAYQILTEAGTPLVMPTGGTTVTLSNGVTFGSFTNLPNNLIAFDAQGAPVVTTTIPGTALSSTASIPLTKDGQTQTIQITPETGYGVVS